MFQTIKISFISSWNFNQWKEKGQLRCKYRSHPLKIFSLVLQYDKIIHFRSKTSKNYYLQNYLHCDWKKKQKKKKKTLAFFFFILKKAFIVTWQLAPTTNSFLPHLIEWTLRPGLAKASHWILGLRPCGTLELNFSKSFSTKRWNRNFSCLYFFHKLGMVKGLLKGIVLVLLLNLAINMALPRLSTVCIRKRRLVVMDFTSIYGVQSSSYSNQGCLLLETDLTVY